MRFSVELALENEVIPKDKNRIILSLLKHSYKSYNKKYYNSLYENEVNKMKSFTFSIYMSNCKFTLDEIVIPDKKMLLNFSTSDMEDGINFYNSFLNERGKVFPVKNNKIRINRINMITEKVIMEEQAIFKTMSPICVREHKGDNKTTWYHSLNELNGQEILMDNLRYQLLNGFSEDRIFDINDLEFEILKNKEVKVKNYGIEVLGNICIIKIKAKPYILEYLYKSGVGSMRSGGFGMVDLI